MNPPTHAGGVVFRCVGDKVEFLIVQARDNPEYWVFPKGHIEAGETAEEAACREVGEEAGAAAQVLGEAGTIEFVLENKAVRTLYFLMRYSGEVEPSEPRGSQWCSCEDARELLSFAEARELLATADELRRQLCAPLERSLGP